eukprot:5233-Heterococcus_DN1.PRE.2
MTTTLQCTAAAATAAEQLCRPVHSYLQHYTTHLSLSAYVAAVPIAEAAAAAATVAVLTAVKNEEERTHFEDPLSVYSQRLLDGRSTVVQR